MIQPKNEFEDLVLSITKNSETLIKETHRKSEETLEYNLTNPRETFSFKASINLGFDSCMIRLTSLELNHCIFNITEENNKLGIYTDTFDEFAFTDLKDELEEILDVSNIKQELLQDELLGPRIIQHIAKNRPNKD